MTVQCSVNTLCASCANNIFNFKDFIWHIFPFRFVEGSKRFEDLVTLFDVGLVLGADLEADLGADLG